jgi:predicted enzyme related to lactoylglutathione lyase
MTEFLSCRPNLEVADLPGATRFWREVLDFAIDLDEPEMGLVLLHRGGAALALVRAEQPGVNQTTALYLGVSGVGELHTRCAERGAEILVGPADHPWGLRDFVIRVPGGHRIAFGERIDAG